MDPDVDLETIRREAARQYGVPSDIHPEDMIWRFILHHRNYPTPEAAVRHYFSDGAESARKLEGIVREHLPSVVSNRKVSILEFASGIRNGHSSPWHHAQSGEVGGLRYSPTGS